jgi:hypothetical protein
MKATWFVAVLIILAVSFQAYGDLVVANPSMEGNFNNGVAEGWTIWTSHGGSFFSSGITAHDGSLSQGLDIYSGSMIDWQMGIYQQMTSLQLGETYNVTAWFQYSVDYTVFPYPADGIPGGHCSPFFSIGIDTSDGIDPIEWTGISNISYGSLVSSWLKVATSFTAVSDTATIFISSTGNGMGEILYPDQPPYPRIGPADMHVRINIDDVSVVPEPATMCLLGFGALSLIRRKRRA